MPGSALAPAGLSASRDGSQQNGDETPLPSAAAALLATPKDQTKYDEAGTKESAWGGGESLLPTSWSRTSPRVVARRVHR
jgi:hypothetical protein